MFHYIVKLRWVTATNNDTFRRNSFITKRKKLLSKVFSILTYIGIKTGAPVNNETKCLSLELWFLCTALLPNEIYLPMKFHVDALHSFEIILRTKGTGGRSDGQTDWRMDGRVDYYMPPFGGIK